MDYHFNVLERILELGYDPEDITPEAEAGIKQEIAKLMDSTFSEGKRLAQERLKTTRIDYLKSFKYEQHGDEWVIDLDDESKATEEGYGPFDMKPGLLAGPNAKISDDGSTYNIIPIKAPIEYGGSGKTEFRVVSSKSPKSSWLHPGFGGALIFPDLASFIDGSIDDIIYYYLGEPEKE